MKTKSSNWHVLFIDRVIALIFLAISILVFGYWRDAAFRYGWGFFTKPGWWLRLVISIVATIPIMIGEKLWTDLRDLMKPYCHHYYDYGEPWFPDRDYLRYRAEDNAHRSQGESAVAEEVYGVVHTLRLAVLLVVVVWGVAFAPLDDYNALACYLICLIVSLGLAFFAGIMAFVEYIRSPARKNR